MCDWDWSRGRDRGGGTAHREKWKEWPGPSRLQRRVRTANMFLGERKTRQTAKPEKTNHDKVTDHVCHFIKSMQQSPRPADINPGSRLIVIPTEQQIR